MKKWILIVPGIIVALIAVFIVYGNFKSNLIDENNLPKFIQADFIVLDKIYSISKFRSGSGHMGLSSLGSPLVWDRVQDWLES